VQVDHQGSLHNKMVLFTKTTLLDHQADLLLHEPWNILQHNSAQQLPWHVICGTHSSHRVDP
jgi:hypothetical protein